ncbi:ankyrin repeat protein [Trichoderma aethiopicum]
MLADRTMKQMASPLASASALPIDVLAPYPAEIIMLVMDYLATDLIYFRFLVEPRSSTDKSYIEQRHRLRDVVISHNVKFNSMSILNLAIKSNDTETVRLVLGEAEENARRSPLKDTVVKHATRPLWTKWFSWAVGKDYLEIAGQMLRVAGMANYLNQDGRYLDKLLLLAIERCNGADMATLLLDHGADPNFFENGDTPLHLAAKMNNKGVISMLLSKYNADANYRGAGGDTPFMEATAHKDMETVRLFLQSPRLNLNQRNHWGETALHKMISRGRPDIAELMLTWDGIETDQRDFKGHTPLMVCLLKMADAADMSLYIPFFKKLLTREGIDMETFRRDYATIVSERLEDLRPDFLLELMGKMGFDIPY